ncbi:MAG: glycosyltransferase family A protein [Faecousia sp.]
MIDNLVSVIIPCYNGERFIDRSIRSVYEQDYPTVELIVVDDGSTDHSKEKIMVWERMFLNKGWKFRYVYQKNRGLGGAIDTGLKYVSGQYLTLLDADDRFLQGSISKKAAYLIQNPSAAAVRSNGWTVSGKNRWLFVQTDVEKNIADIFTALLLGKTNNWAGSYMVRTDLLFSFYPDRTIYPSRFGQNLQLLLPVVYNRRCGFIDEPLMEYIRQEESLSSTASVDTSLQKAIRNADGYLDIRQHLLKQIVTDQVSQDALLKQIYAEHCRSKIQIALAHKERPLLVESYMELKNTTTPTQNDRILYYQLVCRPASFWLRMTRKIKRIILGRQAV